MATADDVFRIAETLAGTTRAPHFDRIAFRVVRTYATLAADRQTLNLKLTPEEQEFKALLAPAAFRPLDNGWGRQGWTELRLSAVSEAELRDALTLAWEHGRAKTPRRRATQKSKSA